MMLSNDKRNLMYLFREWVDKERFGERTPEQFLAFLLSNGLIDETKTSNFIEKVLIDNAKPRS